MGGWRGLIAGPACSSQSAQERSEPCSSPISGLPEGVIGFEAAGEVEATDYENVLIPAISRGAAGGGVRLVLVLGDRFTGYSPGAMKEDVGLVPHAKAWKRTAVVSDVG